MGNRISDDFWSHVDQSGGPDACWPWTRSIRSSGYGQLRINGRAVTTHRRAFELAVGPIPNGMSICHHCDNPPCCNPTHLFAGTNTDNIADMRAKGRGFHQTHCARGHELTPTYMGCQTCIRARLANRQRRRRPERRVG